MKGVLLFMTQDPHRETAHPKEIQIILAQDVVALVTVLFAMVLAIHIMSFWKKVQKITARIAHGEPVRDAMAPDEYLVKLVKE
ncbi:hypothetical protein LI031_24535 [Enterocloster citroniae]|uniref:hypothetical protein n=1 Tax=Enterocloster citroniae TaxID=358743 RepID=UPI001D05FF20|nr:hypothetical protein [Enterocloster citroniae]MCB7067033.1 hypothetical protein [Enterocloster citroniae]